MGFDTQLKHGKGASIHLKSYVTKTEVFDTHDSDDGFAVLRPTQPMVLSCEPWLLASQRLRPPVHEQRLMRELWMAAQAQTGAPCPYRTGHPGNVRQEVGTMDAARDEGVRSRAPHRSGAWGPRRLLGGLARELPPGAQRGPRSEEHTSELQSRQYLVCRLLL